MKEYKCHIKLEEDKRIRINNKMENETESELFNLTTSIDLTKTNTEYNSCYSRKGSLSSSQKYLTVQLKACRSTEDLLIDKLANTYTPELSFDKEDSMHSIDNESMVSTVRSLGKSITPRTYQGRSVGDFHSRYLDVGQWPEMNTNKQAILKKKYQINKLQSIKKDEIARGLASKLRTTQVKKDNYKKLSHKYALGYHQQKATELALKEAIGLSNVLLDQVHKMDARHSLDTPEIYSPRGSTNQLFYRRHSHVDERHDE